MAIKGYSTLKLILKLITQTPVFFFFFFEVPVAEKEVIVTQHVTTYYTVL